MIVPFNKASYRFYLCHQDKVIFINVIVIQKWPEEYKNYAIIAKSSLATYCFQ